MKKFMTRYVVKQGESGEGVFVWDEQTGSTVMFCDTLKEARKNCVRLNAWDLEVKQDKMFKQL